MENIQHTPNRMACTSTASDENENVLITKFKGSPKSPVNEIAKKKKPKKKRAKKTLRQRNRLDSRSSELSDSAQRRSEERNRQASSAYNLIEYYGDDSSRSELSTRDSEYNTAGVSVQRTADKVIFVIPEEWAASIEIVKFPSVISSSLENSSTSLAPVYEQNSNSVGPIRSSAKISRNNRNTPYSFSRRGNYATASAGESVRPAVQNSIRNHGSTSESVEFNRYFAANNGYQYLPLDLQRSSDSIGPIRQKNRRRAFYTPYGNSAHANRRNDISLESAATSRSGSSNSSYNERDSRSNDSNRKNYLNSRRPPRLCWHCKREGHIRMNCPWRMTSRTRY